MRKTIRQLERKQTNPPPLYPFPFPAKKTWEKRAVFPGFLGGNSAQKREEIWVRSSSSTVTPRMERRGLLLNPDMQMVTSSSSSSILLLLPFSPSPLRLFVHTSRNEILLCKEIDNLQLSMKSATCKFASSLQIWSATRN